jgi:hypothetical protein
VRKIVVLVDFFLQRVGLLERVGNGTHFGLTERNAFEKSSTRQLRANKKRVLISAAGTTSIRALSHVMASVLSLLPASTTDP